MSPQGVMTGLRITVIAVLLVAIAATVLSGQAIWVEGGFMAVLLILFIVFVLWLFGNAAKHE